MTFPPVFLAFAVALTSASALAQEPAPAPSTPLPAAPAPSLPPSKTKAEREPARILVLKPTSTTVEPATLEVVASLLSVELAGQRGVGGERFDVLTAADVEKLASLTAEKANLGCDTSGCLAEIAAAMGTRYVLFGDANKLGSLTVITLSVFDAEDTRSLIRKSIEVDDVGLLPAKLRALVPELAGAVLPMTSTSTPSTPPTASTSAPLSPLVWTIGGAALGVAIAAGGLAWDTQAPSSKNGKLDLVLDSIGPAAYVVGAGVVAVAFLVNPLEPAP